MIYELFALTGFALWAFLAIAAIPITICVNDESMPGYTTVWVALAATIAFGFTNLRVDIDPYLIPIYLLSYVVIGLNYTIVRWSMKVRKLRKLFQKSDLDAMGLWRAPSSCGADNYAIRIPPHPGDFSSVLTTWLAYWPVSLVCWMFGDLLSDLYALILRGMSGVLNAISRRGWN